MLGEVPGIPGRLLGNIFEGDRYHPRPKIRIMRLKGRRKSALRGEGIFEVQA